MKILQQIRAANPNRNHDNLARRLIKITEEIGEASEAYLNVTSDTNPKQKSWVDVREELIDTMIVVIDCALTPNPHELEDFDVSTEAGRRDLSQHIEAEIAWLLTSKLAKWQRNRSTMKVVTDDV